MGMLDAMTTGLSGGESALGIVAQPVDTGWSYVPERKKESLDLSSSRFGGQDYKGTGFTTGQLKHAKEIDDAYNAELTKIQDQAIGFAKNNPGKESQVNKWYADNVTGLMNKYSQSNNPNLTATKERQAKQFDESKKEVSPLGDRVAIGSNGAVLFGNKGATTYKDVVTDIEDNVAVSPYDVLTKTVKTFEVDSDGQSQFNKGIDKFVLDASKQHFGENFQSLEVATTIGDNRLLQSTESQTNVRNLVESIKNAPDSILPEGNNLIAAKSEIATGIKNGSINANLFYNLDYGFDKGGKLTTEIKSNTENIKERLNMLRNVLHNPNNIEGALTGNYNLIRNPLKDLAEKIGIEVSEKDKAKDIYKKLKEQGKAPSATDLASSYVEGALTEMIPAYTKNKAYSKAFTMIDNKFGTDYKIVNDANLKDAREQKKTEQLLNIGPTEEYNHIFYGDSLDNTGSDKIVVQTSTSQSDKTAKVTGNTVDLITHVNGDKVRNYAVPQQITVNGKTSFLVGDRVVTVDAGKSNLLANGYLGDKSFMLGGTRTADGGVVDAETRNMTAIEYTEDIKNMKVKKPDIVTGIESIEKTAASEAVKNTALEFISKHKDELISKIREDDKGKNKASSILNNSSKELTPAFIESLHNYIKSNQSFKEDFLEMVAKDKEYKGKIKSAFLTHKGGVGNDKDAYRYGGAIFSPDDKDENKEILGKELASNPFSILMSGGKKIQKQMVETTLEDLVDENKLVVKGSDGKEYLLMLTDGNMSSAFTQGPKMQGKVAPANTAQGIIQR